MQVPLSIRPWMRCTAGFIAEGDGDTAGLRSYERGERNLAADTIDALATQLAVIARLTLDGVGI